MKHDYDDKIQKAKFYKDNSIIVHVVIFNSRNYKFFNGDIVNITNNLLIINDEILGKYPILFREITKIEPRKEKE